MRQTCGGRRHVTPPAWMRMDASGVIRFVSHQAELLFGYDGEDLGVHRSVAQHNCLVVAPPGSAERTNLGAHLLGPEGQMSVIRSGPAQLLIRI